MFSLPLLPKELHPVLVAGRTEVGEMVAGDDLLVKDVGADEVAEGVMAFAVDLGRR